MGAWGGGIPSHQKKKKKKTEPSGRLVSVSAPPTPRPGAYSICPERACSAGSRTVLAPLKFRKMRCQNERKKLALIRYLSHLLRYQAWIWWSTTFLQWWSMRSIMSPKKKNWGTTPKRSRCNVEWIHKRLLKLVDKALSTGSGKPMVRNGSLWIEENLDESLPILYF